MKKILLPLLAALLTCEASAAALDVRGEMSFFAELYPKNSTVTMLVVKGKMRTHLTSLMGEPVLNHQIRLDPFPSVFVSLPDGRIRNVVELTPEIQAAAQKIRFTLVGSLILGSRSPQYHFKTYIPFDSGASVSPGEGNSFNVPGSPAWGRFVRTDLCGESFLNEKTAREIAAGFEKKEFWLASADMCNDRIVVDDSTLREAISKACAVNGKGDNAPGWCPKKPVKEEKPAKNEKSGKVEPSGKTAKDAKVGDKAAEPDKASALDELDQQEIARTAPPPSPAAPAKTTEPKPAPAMPAPIADSAASGKVIFAEDFKAAKGWQGRYEAIESPGCAYLGAAHAGIHMAFSPGGPVWREVTGFTPGQSYEISFEVRTLDPSDAGKATFLVDDTVLHSIRSNGKVSVKFTASRATHRVKFDWKVQSINMAPVHVAKLQITEEDGRTANENDEVQRYLGIWKLQGIGYEFGKIKIERKRDGSIQAYKDYPSGWKAWDEIRIDKGIIFIRHRWGIFEKTDVFEYTLDTNTMRARVVNIDKFQRAKDQGTYQLSKEK